MPRTQLVPGWSEIRRRIKARWGSLTDQQLDPHEGDWEALTTLLQTEIGLTRANARRQLEEIRQRSMAAGAGANDSPEAIPLAARIAAKQPTTLPGTHARDHQPATRHRSGRPISRDKKTIR